MMFGAESALIDAHISNAADGIKLVNSSLVVRNCTMTGGGGIQITGSTPTSLALDYASFSRPTPSGHLIDASLLYASLDLSVTNSHLSGATVMNLACRGHLNIRIINSSVNSTTGGAAVNVAGGATQVTITAASSTFTGTFYMNSFSYAFRLLVCFFKYVLLSVYFKITGEE